MKKFLLTVQRNKFRTLCVLFCLIILAIPIIFPSDDYRINISKAPPGQVYTVVDTYKEEPNGLLIYLVHNHQTGDKQELCYPGNGADVASMYPRGTLIHSGKGNGALYFVRPEETPEQLVKTLGTRQRPQF